MVPTEFAVGQKVFCPRFGTGRVTRIDTVEEKIAIHFDGQKFEFVWKFYLTDGSVVPVLLETTIAKTKREKNAELAKEAQDLALANGYAMHREADSCESIDPIKNPEAFEALVTYCLGKTATLTLTANFEVAESRSVEMHNFVIPVSDKSRDLKSNVAVENSKELGDLQKVLNFNVHTNGWTNGFSEVEICSKELAQELGVRGVIAERSLRKSTRVRGDDDSRGL